MAKASGANRRADNLSHRYATSLISGNLSAHRIEAWLPPFQRRQGSPQVRE